MTRGIGWGALCVCAAGWMMPACVGDMGGGDGVGRGDDAFDPGSGTPGAGDDCSDYSELCAGSGGSAANAAKPDDPPPDCDPVPEDCENGADDDCDGLIDGDDLDCDPPECVPVEETCNGRDDDCDGQVDEIDCVETCEDFEGHSCNGDLGYGDHCAPADNTGGCSPDRFWAWCNRRNPDQGCSDDAQPLDCIWDSYLHDWVDAHCDGEVILVDPDNDGYWTYTCTDSEWIRYECTTPLVLAFEPAAPVTFRADDETSAFDLSAAGDGSGTRTDWPSAVTPWLALDRDGDGLIGSGRELFGSATPTLTGTAQNGFEALAALDVNGDRVIDAADPGFALLVSWADENHDRISQSSELTPLAELGVEAIDLGAWRAPPRCDNRGNCEIERAPFYFRAASGSVREGAVIDVYLRTR